MPELAQFITKYKKLDRYNMKQLELIQKYGVPAVLFIWLGSVQYQMSTVQDRFDDCNEKRFNELKDLRRNHSGNNNILSTDLLAILPKKEKDHE